MAYDQTATEVKPTAATPSRVSSNGAADLAARLDAELRDAHPLTVLRKAYETFGDKLALVSSFGAESAVLLHLASQVSKDIPVLFLDTGMLFGQTLDYRKALAARLGLTDVRDLRPAYTDLAVTDPKSDLWRTDTDACCHIRKVLPLDRALGGFAAWTTGRKRFHGGDRLRLRVVEESEGQIKFNPLANWGKAELDAYVAQHDLPAHPLVAQGFPSVGCWPCTKPVEDPNADVRAGRWAGQDKTECGIHVARAPGAAPNVGEGI
ncbi:phosphoadenylyl-sulfate reductase [Caulobacter sp. LjRoot300]|uniref:phosphoadenylyl-sulfate reductase n=1 Tax=Caulobacter sp. LjRoot300 TaxID=3342321 RepID=UPI003ECCD930